MLTEREKEILELIAQGFSNKQIAEKLCITPLTTKCHIGNIYEKLDIKSDNYEEHGAKRVRAVLYWLKYKEDILENQK